MQQKDTCLPQLPYWDKLSAEEKALVQAHSAVRHYKKGQFIHDNTSDCLGMILLLCGEIRTYLLSEEGREITLFLLHNGDSCVLSASCVISQITFDTHMTAEQDCDLLVVPAGTFAKLTGQNIYVRCFMYELATEHFSSVMRSMQQIIFKGYDRRLAAFLIGEYDRTGIAELRMTHEQIAQHTSSAREVVARMLKRFVSEGLVEVSRGCIRLRAPEQLRKRI